MLKITSAESFLPVYAQVTPTQQSTPVAPADPAQQRNIANYVRNYKSLLKRPLSPDGSINSGKTKIGPEKVSKMIQFLKQNDPNIATYTEWLTGIEGKIKDSLAQAMRTKQPRYDASQFDASKLQQPSHLKQPTYTSPDQSFPATDANITPELPATPEAQKPGTPPVYTDPKQPAQLVPNFNNMPLDANSVSNPNTTTPKQTINQNTGLKQLQTYKEQLLTLKQQLTGKLQQVDSQLPKVETYIQNQTGKPPIVNPNMMGNQTPVGPAQTPQPSMSEQIGGALGRGLNYPGKLLRDFQKGWQGAKPASSNDQIITAKTISAEDRFLNY